jgi:hypothetical protein
MKRIFALLFLLIFSASCQPNIKPEKPQGLIPEAEMSNVLYDMFVINSAKGINRKLLEVNGVVPEKYILEKYKIDSTQFAQSNNYYAHDLEAYKAIIEKVKERINTEKTVFEAINKKEKEAADRRKDSIKAAKQKK